MTDPKSARRTDRGMWITFIAAALLAVATLARAAGPRVGEPAPPLRIARWLAGDSLGALEPGRVYVVDIWAPWCGPCLGGMAHLSDLQDRHRADGLVVIGLAGDDDYGATLAAAQRVVRRKGDAIRYRIAWDRDRATYREWMAREQVSGWPWAFIVDRAGRVAWTGHPEGMDGPLERILAGTWPLDSAARAYRRRADGLDLATAYAADYRAGRDPNAIAGFEALRAHDSTLAASYAPSYFKLLMRSSRRAEAYRFASDATSGMLRDRPEELGRIAALVVDPATRTADRDLDVALACATRADRVSPRPDAERIATLARVYALRGEWDHAVSEQLRAVAAADSSARAAQQQTLARYRTRTP